MEGQTRKDPVLQLKEYLDANSAALVELLRELGQVDGDTLTIGPITFIGLGHGKIAIRMAGYGDMFFQLTVSI